MNQEVIDREFAKLVGRRGVHNELEGVTSGQIRLYRAYLKQGTPISTDLKLKLLHKSGWREDGLQYSRQDLISFANFYKRTSQAARDQGPEYVLEKWEATREKA